MQKYDIHVCLVSDQAAANLLPVSMNDFKPKEAIFLVSEDMKKKGRAESLKKSFQAQGIAVYERDLSSPYDLEITENEILDILESHNGVPFSELDIALNVTGGTKPMAMAALSIFSMADKPVFYVNTDDENVAFLGKYKQNSFKLESNLLLSHYFRSYGYDIKSSEKRNNPKITSIFSDFFIKSYSKNKRVISSINRFASISRNNVYQFKDKDPDFYSLNNFLYELSQEKFILFTEDKIDFLNESNEQFVGGSWLEHYTFQQLKDIEGVNDLSMSVTFSHPDFDHNKKDIDKKNLGKQNEFDLAFTAKNKLHIIECKTVKFNEKGEEDDEKDILYKIEALRKKMGDKVKGGLVSYLPISTALRNRAEDAGIMIIEGQQMQNLKTHLQQWINR